MKRIGPGIRRVSDRARGNRPHIDIDASQYPNITELYRSGWRSIEAHVGRRHFKVAVYEKLSDAEPPRFSVNYEEKIKVRIEEEERPMWVKADLPWEAGDDPDECLRRALAHVDRS
jgi:hypothetical protein